MIRITNTHAGWLLMWIRNLRGRSPDMGPRHVLEGEVDRVNRLEDNGALSAEDARSREFAYLANENGPQLDITDITDPIEKQLNQPDSNETRLVDLLVEVLCAPMQREILAGKTLRDLRKALLTFDERNGLEEKITRAHTHCGSCGHEFESGEMASVKSRFEDGRAAWTIMCTRCAVPMHFACRRSGCDSSMPIPDGKLRWLTTGKTVCEQHKEDKGEAPTVANVLLGRYVLEAAAMPAVPVWHIEEEEQDA